MVRKLIVLLAGVVFTLNIKAQNPAIIRYVNTYKLLAVQEMQRTGVPASIKLAQGILETQAGESDLVKRSHNHFGIKCKTGWNGEKVYHDDDERGECFRAYASAADSYRDHSDFLRRSQRYAFLFNLDPTDYKDWAKGLKKAGYATNPRYTQMLVKYIEDYDLQVFSLIALGKQKLVDEPAMYAAASLQVPDNSPVSLVQQQQNAPAAAKALRLRYPEEAFRINETRVVVGLQGTSLLALAEQYNIKYRHLLDFNELTEADDILKEDQLVFLQRKRRQGANLFHTVNLGETLYGVAQEEGIRLDHLLVYNQLQGNETLQPGQKLYLQKGAAEQAAFSQESQVLVREAVLRQPAPESMAEADPTLMRLVKHVVQQKETLFSISRKYEVGVDQIRSWNRLNTDTIRSGQELLIYKN